MLKKFFLSLICLAMYVISFAQKKEVRKIDWQDFVKSITNTNIAKPVPFGQFTVFQIENINRFLYKVEIEGKAFILETPIPSELETLFRLNQTDLAKTATNKKSEEGVQKLTGATVDGTKALAFRTTANGFNKSKEEDEFKIAFQALTDKIGEYRTTSKEVSVGIFQLKSCRNKLISIAQMDVTINEISTEVARVPIPTDDIKSIYIEQQDLYDEVQQLGDEAKDKAKEMSPDDVAEKSVAQVEDILKKVEQGKKLIDEEGLLGLITDVEFLSKELLNPNNFKITSPPVQMEGDLVVYKTKVTPVVTRSLGAHKNPIEFDFNIPAQGGLKVDFSVGPVISFGKGSKDQKYFLKETANPDSVTLESRDNNNHISPGIAALMHFYKRSGKPSFNWGGLFGIGAGFETINDVNLSIYGGVSAVLGKTQKIMVGLGVGFLRVDRIKETEFVAGNKYAVSKIELGNVTEKAFTGSVFFTISYNLTNRKEVN